MKRLVAFLTIGFCLLLTTPAGAQESGPPTVTASYVGCGDGITVTATGEPGTTLTVYLKQGGGDVLDSGTLTLTELQADPAPAGWTYTAPDTYVWNFPYGSAPSVPDGTYDVEVYVTDAVPTTVESKFSADVLATCVEATTTTVPATTTTIAATTTTAAAAATSTTPTTVTVGVGAGALPFTGAHSGRIAVVAIALLGAGAVLYVGSRRVNKD